MLISVNECYRCCYCRLSPHLLLSMMLRFSLEALTCALQYFSGRALSSSSGKTSGGFWFLKGRAIPALSPTLIKQSTMDKENATKIERKTIKIRLRKREKTQKREFENGNAGKNGKNGKNSKIEANDKGEKNKITKGYQQGFYLSPPFSFELPNALSPRLPPNIGFIQSVADPIADHQASTCTNQGCLKNNI